MIVEILVDTSVWIDYFRSGRDSERMDFLISENLVATNDIILAELVPLLLIRNEKKVVSLLKKIKNNSMQPNWQEIIDFQVKCLKAGSSGIGIPDLLIAQNAVQYRTPVYSLDKHFKLMLQADLGIESFA